MQEVKFGSKTVKEKTIIQAPFEFDTVRGILSNKTYIGRQNTRKHLKLLTLSKDRQAVDLQAIISEYDFNLVQKIIKDN